VCFEFSTDTAVLLRQYMFGNNKSIEVQEFAWRVGNMNMTFSVTDECVPVIEQQTGEVDGGIN